MKNFKPTLICCLAFMFAAVQLFAQDVPRDLSNLVDIRANSLDSEMSRKGYEHIKTDKSTAGIYSYWWNNRRNKCAIARISDGRVKSIVATLPADCNKSYNSNSNYGYNSNHRDDNQDQAYNRGYDDAKRDRSNRSKIYSSEVQISAYNRGYEDGAGGEANENENYGNKEKFEDLDGWISPSAYAVLQTRGFTEVKDYNKDGKQHKLWWNNDTRQCVKTSSQDNKITKIASSSKCRR